MATIQNEGFVNNSNTAVALVSWSSGSCKCIIELLPGNNNKFKTIEECDEMCVENDFKLMLTDKCEQPIEPGPW